jgi:hypothetical protein
VVQGAVQGELAVKAPRTPRFEQSYADFVKSEALWIDADGCSGPAAGFRVICCLEHDLAYYYGRDPRAAYRGWRDGVSFALVWTVAPPIDREEVDRRFRTCLQNEASLGKYSPMAWWRWAGVRIGGSRAWNKHREQRA